MRKFRKYWSVFTLVLIFAVGFTMRQLAPTPVKAAGAAPVTVENFPATQNVNVTNTPLVNAAESGTWNVGITGTPNVNVNSLPAINFAPGASVNVANTAVAPLYFDNVSDSGRNAYQSTAECVPGATDVSLCVATFTVPNGHRLVIQHVTGGVPLAGTQLLYAAGSVFSDSSWQSRFILPITGDTVAWFDQAVTGYVDAISRLFVAVHGHGLNVSVAPGSPITVSGYLLDCAAAPCAAIAH